MTVIELYAFLGKLVEMLFVIAIVLSILIVVYTWSHSPK